MEHVYVGDPQVEMGHGESNDEEKDTHPYLSLHKAGHHEVQQGVYENQVGGHEAQVRTQGSPDMVSLSEDKEKEYRDGRPEKEVGKEPSHTPQ
jgi:hypothetical protein